MDDNSCSCSFQHWPQGVEDDNNKMQTKRTTPTTAAAAEPPHHHGYKYGKRDEGMAGMARAYQYAHFFLIFFVPSHTVTAQTVRRDTLLHLNYSITDCMHSLQWGEVILPFCCIFLYWTQQGEVILPSQCFFSHSTQQGEDDLPSCPVFSCLSQQEEVILHFLVLDTMRGGRSPLSAHFVALITMREGHLPLSPCFLALKAGAWAEAGPGQARAIYLGLACRFVKLGPV